MAASLLAGRVRLPALVLFLAVGMAIGSDGANWIDFADYELARRIGVIALALILFEGGLAVRWSELRPVARPAVMLASVGTIVTAGITGVGAYWLFDLSLLEALLLGAILSATDGAAIFALLRGSSLRRRVARTLEGEAGLNDGSDQHGGRPHGNPLARRLPRPTPEGCTNRAPTMDQHQTPSRENLSDAALRADEDPRNSQAAGESNVFGSNARASNTACATSMSLLLVARERSRNSTNAASSSMP